MGLMKSLQQSASETALCVDIRLAAAILTNLLSKQAVCLFTSSTSSGGKYVQIPRASVKLLVTYFMYTPLCKVYVSKYYQAGYIHTHPTDLTGHPHRTDTCSVWVMRFLQGRVAVVIFRLQVLSFDEDVDTCYKAIGKSLMFKAKMFGFFLY